MRNQPVKPRLFIGSSTEGKSVAQAIQFNLTHVCESVIWNQAVFGLGGSTLETIVKESPKYDFAVLVLSADDKTSSRQAESQAPRDNVLLELGLFLGVLGRKRTFIVYESGKQLKLPSDLAGVTLAAYQKHSNDNMVASMGPACTQIEMAIDSLGIRDNTKHSLIQDLRLFIEKLQLSVVHESSGRTSTLAFTQEELSKLCNYKKLDEMVSALFRQPEFQGLMEKISDMPPSFLSKLELCLKPARKTWYEMSRISPLGQTDAGQQAERLIASHVVYSVRCYIQKRNHPDGVDDIK